MQSSSITLVADINDANEVEEVRKFINTRKSLVCIDITSGTEESGGHYIDCIVPSMFPLVMTHEPIIRYRAALQDVFKSFPVFVVCCLAIVLGIPCLFVSLVFSDSSTQVAVFVLVMLVINIVFGLILCNSQWRILAIIVKTFDFWFMSLMHSLSCVTMGYLFNGNSIPLYVTVPLLTIFDVFVCLLVFGIDATEWSHRMRTALLICFVFTYALLGLCGRFVEDIFSSDVVDAFINSDVSLFISSTTPRVTFITSITNIFIFTVRYAGMMFMGKDFVLISFDAKYSAQEVGTVHHDPKIRRRHTIVKKRSVSPSPPNFAVGGGGRRSPAAGAARGGTTADILNVSPNAGCLVTSATLAFSTRSEVTGEYSSEFGGQNIHANASSRNFLGIENRQRSESMDGGESFELLPSQIGQSVKPELPHFSVIASVKPQRRSVMFVSQEDTDRLDEQSKRQARKQVQVMQAKEAHPLHHTYESMKA